MVRNARLAAVNLFEKTVKVNMNSIACVAIQQNILAVSIAETVEVNT